MVGKVDCLRPSTGGVLHLGWFTCNSCSGCMKDSAHRYGLAPYAKEFVANLKAKWSKSIDAIVINHGDRPQRRFDRADEEIQIAHLLHPQRHQVPRHYRDWNFVPVKTGDTLDLGSTKLIFVEAPMLHWPDTMFTYMTEENILFSNDAFGQHYATESLFNDTVDQCELCAQAIKYYANILTPFSRLVKKKIKRCSH